MSEKINQICMHFVKLQKFYFFITLAFIIGFCTQIPSLSIEGDLRKLFQQDDFFIVALEKLEKEFQITDDLVVIIELKEGNFYSLKNLLMLEEFTKEAWQTPFSIRVNSLSNFLKVSTNDDTIELNELFEHGASTSERQLQDIHQYIKSHKTELKPIISSDGTASAISINVVVPEHDRMENIKNIVTFARQLQDKFQTNYPNAKVYLNGGVMFERTLAESLTHDLLHFIPIIDLICFAILYFFMRSLMVVVSIIFVMTATLLLNIGVLATFDQSLSIVSVMAPLMAMILAIADCIHLLNHYNTKVQSGMSNDEAMWNSLVANLKPIFLTSITTAIGFLGMNFSISPAFHDLGNYGAIGVLIAFLLTMTCLPFLMSLFPVSATKSPPLLIPLMEKLSDLSISYHKRIFWVFLVSSFAFISFIPNNTLSDNFAEYFGPSTQFGQSIKIANDKLSGYQNISYAFPSNEPGGINNPQFLSKMDAFSEWYRDQPGVTGVMSYVDIIKQVHATLLPNSTEPLPTSRELAAQYLLLYELALPYGATLSQLINDDRSSIHLQVSLHQLSNNELSALEERAHTWLLENAPEYQTMGSGQSLMLARLTKLITLSMIIGSLYVLMLITVVLIIGLKSVKYGLLSMIPNLLPAAVVYGLWGIFVQEINFVVSLTFAASLGLVVDDTVHFVSKYRSARERQLPPNEAIRYSFVNSGPALLLTTFGLAAGLSILAWSSFWPSAMVGIMISATLVVALILDFSLLPGLLLVTDKNRPVPLKAEGTQLAEGAGS